MTRIARYVIAALALGLSACTNPYDPVQRGLGGGILGAASGAAIGAAAGGGPGAALGAAIGGATGIVGGVASTPPPPRAPISATQPTATGRTDLLRTDIRATPSPAMAIRATRKTPLTPLLRAMDTQATQDSPPTPPRVTDRQATRDTPTPDPRPLRRQATRDGQLAQVVRAMNIRARRPILRTPVPVIPAIALRRTGRLGPSTRSSLLAEFWPDTKSSRRCAGGSRCSIASMRRR